MTSPTITERSVIGTFFERLQQNTASSVVDAISTMPFQSDLNSELPAVLIEEGDEITPGLSLKNHADRRLNVRASVLIKGEQSYQFADEPLVEVYDRIMKDRTISGLALDLVEGPTKRERMMLEKPVAIITKNFIVRYRTAEDSLL